MVNPKSFGQFTMMHHDLPSLIFEQSLIFLSLLFSCIKVSNGNFSWHVPGASSSSTFSAIEFGMHFQIWPGNCTEIMTKRPSSGAQDCSVGCWWLEFYQPPKYPSEKVPVLNWVLEHIHCVMETAHQGIMQRRRRISSRRWDDNLSSQCVTTMRCLMIDSDCFLRVFQLSWGDPHFFLKKCCAGGASWVPWIPAFDTLCFQASGSTNLSVPKIWGVEALVIRG